MPIVKGKNLVLLFSFTVLFWGRCFCFESPTVRYLGIEQGLSNNAVRCIFQDHLGFIWFGTYDGLNRYDGYHFKIFRNIIGDKNSLVDNHITAINADADRNIWVGSEKGLNIYNPVDTKFSVPVYKPMGRTSLTEFKGGVHAIQPISDGETLLVGAEKNGLIVFKKNRPGYPVALGRYGTSYEVTAMAFDSVRQTVWVFVSKVGLCQYDIKKGNLSVVSDVIRQADCLKTDRNGIVWLGNENGLFRLDHDRQTFSGNQLPSRFKVVGLFEDRQGVLWIASDGGGVWSTRVDAIDPKPLLSSKGTAIVNSNAVYTIYEDADARKWVGTLRGGINVIDRKGSSFKLISYSKGGADNTIDNYILSFCEGDKNKVWIGTDGAGLRYWDRLTNNYSVYLHDQGDLRSISSNFVTSVITDFQKDLWVATWFGGVNRLRNGSTNFEHFSCFNPETNAEERNIWIVYEDRAKRLWASATNNGTLYVFNRATNRFELFDNRIQNVQCLSEDNSGALWAGDYSALTKIDLSKKRHLVYKIGYTIRSIHEDKFNNFWIGTDGGGLLLFNRSNGRFTRFTTGDGLPSNSILKLLEDDKGNLWLSTYNGLCKFNIATKSSKSFSVSDGLQSNQFSFNAGLKLKSGEFLFGGIRGFNIFFPDSVTESKETPPVFLTELKVDNTPIEQDTSFVTGRTFEKIQEIKLPYNKAILSLDFVALEYTGSDKIKYAYFLQGWDKNWNYVNDARTANYSRLQEGSYLFKVRVMNPDGAWSPETQLLKIIVLPPWYRTIWAYLLYTLIVLSGIYFYMLYTRRQERLKYEIKLAHLTNEKEKELNEKKISFFTHISHEFRSPLTLIVNPLKDLMNALKEPEHKKDASMIYRNARRLLSLVDQLLLFRKAEAVDEQLRVKKFDLVDACREVYLSFLQHAASRKIKFEYIKASSSIPFYGDKEKIEIILFNLLSNAFKYTKSDGQIDLILEETENEVRVIVKDTGSGISPDAGDKIFDSFYQSHTPGFQPGFGVGLYVSNRLARAHGGSLNYISKVGEGSEFRLLLLKGKAHFPQDSIIDEREPSLKESFLHELVEDPVIEGGVDKEEEQVIKENESKVIDRLTSDLPTMLIVDDDSEIRAYIKRIFIDAFLIYEAQDGTDAYTIVLKERPDIVVSDVVMKKMGGIELCQKIKQNPSTAHIPVILLTASSSDETKLKGIKEGADDYINKPFDTEIIVARVQNIIKGRSRLQQYFFNSVTMQPTTIISGEQKEFVEACIRVVEDHLDDPDFSVELLGREMGMSHASLYKKVKAVSGLTVNVFIRYIRLRKAAEILITTSKTITEVAYITGFSDIKYFREQFFKLFQIRPSEFVKKYRRSFGAKTIQGGL